MVDTCGGSVPCLDKIARMSGCLFSDDGRSILIEYVADRQAMYGEKRSFILSCAGAFMEIHALVHLRKVVLPPW